MRRYTKHLAGATLVLALSAGGTALAAANGWTVPSTALISAKVAKMPRGVTPSAARQSGTAVVSWSAQEITDGVRMDHYVVTAHSIDDPPLPDITRTIEATGGTAETVAFTAAELAGGKWYWTIAPVYRNWTGAESGKSQRLNFPGTPPARPASTDPAAEPTAAAPAGIAPTTPTAPNQPATTTPATTSPVTTETTEPADPVTTATTTAPAGEPTPGDTATTGS
ncbi:hypothetical protein [Actinoplanes sp. NPDC026619]|uniref:hypothetical protein n=1 Tax=Actinoplanes sp. NPDC026619 TaxID=3155798 RepID=UPI0033C6F64E